MSTDPPHRHDRPDEDDDGWPAPTRDPEQLEHMRQQMRDTIRQTNRRVLRYVYAGLGVLLIVVIVLALTR